MLTVLAFLVAISVLVAVHEWGHYRTAVAFGVKVLRFSLGFGRVIYRRQMQRDGTEFVVSALPLGGYVRMLDEREGPVAPEERHRAFNNKPLWQRAAIVAAGPAANLVLAVLLYAASHWIGIDEPKPVIASPPAQSLAAQAGLRGGDWIQAWRTPEGEWADLPSMSALRWQLTQAAMEREPLQLSVSRRDGSGRRAVTLDLAQGPPQEIDGGLADRLGLGHAYSEAVLGGIQADGPAAAAGLREGDRVLAVDEQPIEDAAQLRQKIRRAVAAGQGVPMRWSIARGDQTLQAVVTPRVVDAPENPADPDAPRSMGRVDAYVGAAPAMVTVRQGPLEGVVAGIQRTQEMAVTTLRILGRMLIGQASLKNLSGPLTIADFAGQTAQHGISHYLAFLGLLSVSLGVLNLLPLPMLDGGHLMYYLFEGLTGRPVSQVWLERLQRGGLAVLLLMMSVALFNDVARLLGLH